MNSLVSVIVPTFNRHAPLSELAEALARQTYKNIEIIIINDNGESVDFIKELYPELLFNVVNLKENKKHVYARNVGIGYANGEFIMFCDDDDLILPQHVETMVREIHESDLVYSDVEIVQFETSGHKRIPIGRKLFAYEYDEIEIRRFSTFVPSGCLFRRSILNEIGSLDEEVYHYWDWDFILRVAKGFKVKRVPVASVLYAFAINGDNLSSSLIDMEPFLDKLTEKHNLGKLPTKNFLLLLDEPEVKSRESKSSIIWDGEPIISRYSI